MPSTDEGRSELASNRIVFRQSDPREAIDCKTQPLEHVLLSLILTTVDYFFFH